MTENLLFLRSNWPSAVIKWRNWKFCVQCTNRKILKYMLGAPGTLGTYWCPLWLIDCDATESLPPWWKKQPWVQLPGLLSASKLIWSTRGRPTDLTEPCRYPTCWSHVFSTVFYLCCLKASPQMTWTALQSMLLWNRVLYWLRVNLGTWKVQHLYGRLRTVRDSVVAHWLFSQLGVVRITWHILEFYPPPRKYLCYCYS